MTILQRFTEEKNQKLIFKIFEVLKPEEYFIIEVNHRDYLLSNFQSRNFIKLGENFWILYERNFDFVNSRLNGRRIFIKKNKKIKKIQFSIRLYTLTELIQMYQKANLICKECYEDYEKKLIDFNTGRYVLITQKSKKN